MINIRNTRINLMDQIRSYFVSRQVARVVFVLILHIVRCSAMSYVHLVFETSIS